MKKILSLFFCFFCFIVLCSCEKSQIRKDTETYSRIGDTIINARIERVIPFEEAYTLADLTATIEIEELVDTYISFSNDGVDLGVSVFSAKILDTHHCSINELSDTIYVVQAGLPSATYKSYPLFKSGDILLLNLRYSTGSESNDYENIFWIINSLYGILQVDTFNGENYIVNRSTPDYISNVPYSKTDNSLIKNNILSNDIILSDAEVNFNGVFDYDTFVNYIEEIEQ